MTDPKFVLTNLILQVSVLAPNVPTMYEMHFGEPMAGAMLHTINMRLDANNIAAILWQCEAKLFFCKSPLCVIGTLGLELGCKGRVAYE